MWIDTLIAAGVPSLATVGVAWMQLRTRRDLRKVHHDVRTMKEGISDARIRRAITEYVFEHPNGLEGAVLHDAIVDLLSRLVDDNLESNDAAKGKHK